MKRILWLGFVMGVSAHADERIGRFFEMNGPTDGTPLFVQKIERRTADDGLMISKSTIEDANGKVVMTETAEIRGEQIVSQRMDQLQIGESYELKVEGAHAIFKTFSIVNGERRLVSEKKVKREGSLITGPATERFLKPRLSKTGQIAEAQFGIFELEKGVNFRFEHKGEVEDGRRVRVSMRPASVWLKMFVSEIHMEFDKETFRMTNYKGRTPVRRLVNGKWKPLDAQIVYESTSEMNQAAAE